jgi:4-amino-4-deoxy-L-arabinose transferase-like glycosyltransferase
MENFFLALSTFFALISPMIGITSIFKGTYKPQRTTRAIFLIISLIFLLSLFKQQNKSGILLAIIQFCMSCGIFVLSFKYGVGGSSKSDFFVFCLAMAAILAWRITNDPRTALYIGIFADVVGFSPTILKSYRFPYSEEPKFYL